MEHVNELLEFAKVSRGEFCGTYALRTYVTCCQRLLLRMIYTASDGAVYEAVLHNVTVNGIHNSGWNKFHASVTYASMMIRGDNQTVCVTNTCLVTFLQQTLGQSLFHDFFV